MPTTTPRALLTATTAIALALGGVPSLPLMAQDTAPNPAECVPTADTPCPPLPEGTAEGNPDAAADQPVEPAAEAPAEQPAEQPAAQAPAEQPAAEAPAEQSAEQPAAEAPAEQPAEQPAAEAAAERPEPEATAEQPAAEAGAEPPAARPAVEATAGSDTSAPVAEFPAEVVQEVMDALTNDPAADAPAAAAATAPEATAAEVTTETVTEENTRQSDEDFATAPSAEAPAKKGGLSDFEKFGLAALGVLTVGAILNNGNKVVSNTGDRVVLERPDGELVILRDDDTLIRQPGSEVQTERFNDGSTRTTVLRQDGSRIVTIRDASGRVLRRARVAPDGTETLLIDDTAPVERVDVSTLPDPRDRTIRFSDTQDAAALRAALVAADEQALGRSFSLRQIRDIREVRKLAPEIDLDTVTFDTGSAAIRPSEAEELSALGRLIAEIVAENPGEVFLIEGHTDAVGNAGYNLALSDRRAESVALALTEYYGVPAENLVVQGFGESDLKVPTDRAERLNRRVSVRLITPLLREAATR